MITYIFAIIFVGLILFLPAGTFKYWNAWLYLGTMFIPMFFALIYLIIKDPDLLDKRMKTKEKEKTQKIYLASSFPAFMIPLIFSGLDFRFGWSPVPELIAYISAFIMLCGYVMFFMVMKQNSYASRVIEIQEEQKLIDTGLYSVVRHPMYTAATLLFFFAPLVLGSFYGLISSLFIPFLLVIRIKNEEKVLLNGLKGYDLFMKKVKYRMIPFVW